MSYNASMLGKLKKCLNVYFLISFPITVAYSIECDPKILKNLLKNREKTILSIQDRLWKEFKKRNLVYLILKQSSMGGAPQFVNKLNLPDTPETYELYFPRVTLYGEIIVLTNGSTYLDIHPKFAPLSETGLADHYLKTMITYAMDREGKEVFWSKSGGIGDVLHRYYREFNLDDKRSVDRTKSDARKLVAYGIWFGIKNEERVFLAHHFFEDQKRVYDYYLSPMSKSEEQKLDEPYKAIRLFGLNFEEALKANRLNFDFDEEYAGLLIRPN